MKLHLLLAAAAALLCAAPIFGASEDNTIVFEGVEENDTSVLVDATAKRTPRPTRRTRRPTRTPPPTRRPPSAARRKKRKAQNLVRRVNWKKGECEGPAESLSIKCQKLNKLVCSYRRRELERRERNVCEEVGLPFGRRRRPSENEQLVEFDEEEDVIMEEE